MGLALNDSIRTIGELVLRDANVTQLPPGSADRLDQFVADVSTFLTGAKQVCLFIYNYVLFVVTFGIISIYHNFC